MVPDLADAICLLCGPQPMIEAMTGMLQLLGVPKPQISHEVFQAAVAASAGAAAPAAPVSEASGSHHVRFNRSNLTADVAATQTVLEAAECCGADIPSLCRAGVCGTCRTRVLSGDVRCASGMLDEQDRADGFVLSCVTHVLSDAAVDA
jgi:ferredoxin